MIRTLAGVLSVIYIALYRTGISFDAILPWDLLAASVKYHLLPSSVSASPGSSRDSDDDDDDDVFITTEFQSIRLNLLD